jgi:hypothetical protein
MTDVRLLAISAGRSATIGAKLPSLEGIRMGLEAKPAVPPADDSDGVPAGVLVQVLLAGGTAEPPL